MLIINLPNCHILMKMIEVRENLPKRTKKSRGILISQNYSTHLCSIHITKFEYSCILIKVLEMIDKSPKNVVGIPTKLLISQLLEALNYETWLLIDATT